MPVEVSHGRGGAGNISVDDTKYVDGEVVRSGIEGSHGDGAYSAGRGVYTILFDGFEFTNAWECRLGAGNIGDIGATTTARKDADIVPDVAVRTPLDEQDFHTGRGGAGNEHHKHDDAHKVEEKAHHDHGQHHSSDSDAPVSLADKLKGKLFGALKK
ncbi:hypothetical protein Golomagni_06305 [Golovinomyces magnicellulatus]|nr:hypothetical protein Golomagni_06305 [Golovinomyces magnicellulatus]